VLVSLVRQSLAPHGRLLLGLVAAQLVSVAASLYLPNLNADIVDHGVVRADTGYIWRTGGWMLLVSLVQVCAAICAAWFSARIAMNAGRDMRARVFGAVQRFSSREVAEFGAPSLITRSTNDVQQVQMLVLMGANLMVTAPIMMVGGVVMALHQDVGLSWLMVVAVPVLAVAIGLIVSRMVPGFRTVQERLDGVNRVMREHLSGIRVVRPGTARVAAFRRRQLGARERADPRRQPHGLHVPDGVPRHEPLDGRHLVVRRPPRR